MLWRKELCCYCPSRYSSVTAQRGVQSALYRSGFSLRGEIQSRTAVPKRRRAATLHALGFVDSPAGQRESVLQYGLERGRQGAGTFGDLAYRELCPGARGVRDVRKEIHVSLSCDLFQTREGGWS